MKPQDDRGVSENALSMGNTAEGGKGALEGSHADPAASPLAGPDWFARGAMILSSKKGGCK